MFKHILIPTDGSNLSAVAARNAVAFAKSIGARVTAMTVSLPYRVFSTDYVMVTDTEEKYEPLRVDPTIEAGQAARLRELRESRDGAAVEAALADLEKAAQGTENVLLPMREALRLRATVGEVCHTLRGVWGIYRPVERF